MALFGRDGGGDAKGVRRSGSDALRLTVAYVKQETLQPLRALGRFVLFGTVGSIFLAVGLVLLLVASLRILQTETGEFHGDLSWVPYAIVAVMAVVIMALAAWRIVRGPAARRRPVRPDEPKTS